MPPGYTTPLAPLHSVEMLNASLYSPLSNAASVVKSKHLDSYKNNYEEVNFSADVGASRL